MRHSVARACVETDKCKTTSQASPWTPTCAGNRLDIFNASVRILWMSSESNRSAKPEASPAKVLLGFATLYIVGGAVSGVVDATVRHRWKLSQARKQRSKAFRKEFMRK